MGLIAMSERDLQRIEVLSNVLAGRMTLLSAAHVLDLSERQVRRLLERIRTSGAASIRHKAIGRPSNNRISDGVRDYAVTLVRERYADFGPTLATEKLAERDGLHVSRETVRRWMVDAGFWLSRNCINLPVASSTKTSNEHGGPRSSNQRCSDPSICTSSP